MTEPIPHAHGGNPLTKKIGPLPAFAYVLIIVAGAYLYRAYRNRAGGTVAALNTSASAVPDPNASTGTTVTNAGGSPATATGETNAQWSLRVANGLATSAFPPSLVSQALTDYLNGKSPLPATEAAVISAAVLEFGYPPEGVLPITAAPTPVPAPVPVATPKPAPKPVPKPPAKKPAPKPAPPKAPPKPVLASHVYTVQPGDNLTVISDHFYGNPSGVSKIVAANHIANPNLIFPGQRLVIPA